MRYLNILFFAILLSCGNSSSGDAPGDNKTPSGEVSGSSAAQENRDFVDEPIMGGPTKVELNITDIKEGKSYLIASVAGGNFRADSSFIENGKLLFENKEGMPQGLYYASMPNQSFVQMFLGEDQSFTLQFDTRDIVGSMVVNGSKENEIFYTNLKYEESYNPKFRALTTELSQMDKTDPRYAELDKQKKQLEAEREKHLQELYKGNEDLLFVKFKQAGQNPKVRENVSDAEKVYFYRKEFWDNVDFSERRLIRTPVITNKLKRYIKELTPQSPDSIKASAQYLTDMVLLYPDYFKLIANWITIEYEPAKTDLMDAEAVFVFMIQNYFTRERAFWSDSMEVYALQQRAFEMSNSLVGLKGPDVVAKDQYGNTQSIYEKTADYIIVYMYNPTCEHCMEQTPKLVEWYNKNKNKGVDVFAIAIDTDEEEWKNYINKTGMTFTNVFDPTNQSIYAKYYVNVTPELYVLNKDRTIIGKNLKVFQIDTIIERDREGQ